jgi:glycine/D-amino acid oxidase-like deaminating enzyme
MALDAGAELHGETRALALDRRGPRRWRVATNQGDVDAGDVVRCSCCGVDVGRGARAGIRAAPVSANPAASISRAVLAGGRVVVAGA